jgi:hypothetical protein
MLLELAAERASGHAKEARRLALVPPGIAEGIEEALAFKAQELGVPALLAGGIGVGRSVPG